MRRAKNCMDCGVLIDWSKVRLGIYWCRACDKRRIHRINASLSKLASAAPRPCDCIYCREDQARVEERP